MELGAYLDRIGYRGAPRPDRATLDEVQRRHHLAIPYESLDVMLGRPLTTSPAEAYDKIVRRRRGGWCYEMNGLMGWALGEIGFKVTRLAGAVMRSALGDAQIGNHLVLRVDLPEGPVIADVGLGDGPFEPFAVIEGPFQARGLNHRLESLGGGWWRTHNPAWARPPDFDFHLQGEDEAALSAKCAELQSSPESIFVMNLICQRFLPGSHVDLVGLVLREVSPAATTERVLEDAADLARTLREVFGVDMPEAGGAWPRILEQHRSRLAHQAGAGQARAQG
jgi:N-hydroxyarylamine O-acetyltransferase